MATNKKWWLAQFTRQAFALCMRDLSYLVRVAFTSIIVDLLEIPPHGVVVLHATGALYIECLALALRLLDLTNGGLT